MFNYTTDVEKEHPPSTIEVHHDPDSLTCEKNSWREGRRIIEMGTLADNLKKGCGMCGNILQFSNILGERRFGLGQVFFYTVNL